MKNPTKYLKTDPIFINSYNSTIHDAEILSNDLVYFL